MTQLGPGYRLRSTRGLDALSVRTFHDIARLRQEVFVVEQDCVYLDLDGRDAEPTTLQYWIEVDPAYAVAGESVAATLRVLSEADLMAIGRVVTGAAHRGRGLAAALMSAAVTAHGASPLVLEAQSHLTGWYGQFGFAVSGAEYLEDGIPHTPMRRG